LATARADARPQLAARPVTHPDGGAHHQHGHDAEASASSVTAWNTSAWHHHGADEDGWGVRHEARSAHSASSTGGHEPGAADGIEWEDDMVDINRLTTTANMHWKFVDRTT
jgi:hypothetical protein